MEREDILKSGKLNIDIEHEKHMMYKGFLWGTAGMAILYLVLMFANIFIFDKQDVSDLTCLTAGFIGVTAIRNYFNSKKIVFLIIGICMSILTICTFVSFILRG